MNTPRITYKFILSLNIVDPKYKENTNSTYLIGCNAEISQHCQAFNRKYSKRLAPMPKYMSIHIFDGIVNEKNGKKSKVIPSEDPNNIIIIDSSLLSKYLLNTSRIAKPIVPSIKTEEPSKLVFLNTGINVIKIPINPIKTENNRSLSFSRNNVHANITTQIGVEKFIAVTIASGSFFNEIVKKNIDTAKINERIK